MSFIKNNKMRSSVREYTCDKKLSKEEKSKFIEILQNVPTSNNFFMSSSIIIEDKQTLKKLSEITNQYQIKDCSMFVLFLADFNRLNYILDLRNHENYDKGLNSLLVGTGDSFIAATMIQDAATEMGLGTCFIGGVRGHIEEISQLLKIEGVALPIIGITIGYPLKKSQILKPKQKTTFFEKYDYKLLVENANEYNDNLKNFYNKLGIPNDYFTSAYNSLCRNTEEPDQVIKKCWNLEKNSKEK
ncbi:nitroreductase family protein [Mycoplasmopsis lipofaciens]|uniref:nitroreductase family protein n=1 Tax=Mycoplasmopsis lipofaciens TaxID=114884 RepID=UPI00068EE63B|nr:nitroreductase family protein [Mycoplasmopsis lipofaciens]